MSNDIYTYIEDKFNIKITDYKFKRDYILNPLKKIKLSYELPYKEDLEYLYITLNLTYSELNLIFNFISKRTIERWCHLYQIKKDSNQIFLCICKTNLEKYGVKFPTQIPQIRQKGIETSLKRNGFKTCFCLEEHQNNIRQTIKKKYNVDNVFQSEKIKNKIKQTNLEKYGVEYNSQRQDVKDKCIKTNLQRYGVKCCLQNPNIKNKVRQTNLQRYGVENYSQTIESKERHRKTNLQRYGVENPSQCSYIQNKKYETMFKNHSFGTSKAEEEIYNLLCQKYNDVKRQYKSEKYPFNCDFYIPSIDTYIEYQGFWTHNFEPYLGTDNQKEIVKLWESKNNDYYNDAIKTWTVRDPLKRQTAKENNLNWFEFFDMTQFLDWFNIIQNKTT